MTKAARRFSTFACLVVMGVMLVPAVQAAAIDPSAELVRVVGSSDTYVILKGKKHLLRTKEAITSYERRGLAVKNISVARFKAATGVRLVHSSIGPRVYLLDETSGQKVWFPTEESFTGSKEKWENVLEITPEDSRALRNAHVIKVAGKPDVYELNIEKGTRQLIPDEAAFRARNYSWKDIVSVPQALLEGYAPVSTANEDSNEMPEPSTPPAITPEPSTTPPGPVGSPALAVSLTTFAPTTLPSGTTRNPIATFGLKATNGPATVRSLTFNKIGFIRDQDVEGLWLLDDQGFLLTQAQHFNEGKVTFTLSPTITILSNQTRSFTVAASFPTTLVSGQTTFGLGVVAASGITTETPVAGVFPLNGPLHRIIQSNGLVARLSVDGVLISTTARSASVGSADQILNRYHFVALNNAEDVYLDRLLITHLGNGSLSSFDHYEVLDEQNRVITKDVTIVDRALRINFGRSGYKIPRGESETLTLRADVVSGGNSNSSFIIMNDYDIYARGGTQGFGIAPSVGTFDGNFPVGDRNGGDINTVHIEPGDVLVTLNAASPTGPVSSGANDVVLATFDVRPLGQALQWDRLKLQVLLPSGGYPLRDLVKLRIKGGAVIGSIDASVAGQEAAQVNFVAAPLIATGKTLTVEVLANVPTQATTSDSYQVQISNAQFLVPGTSSRLSFDAHVSGATRTVQSLSLRVRLDPKFIATQDASGRKSVKIGRYLFQASAGEKIRIESVSLVPVGSQTLFFSDGFSNLKLGSKIIATPSTSPFIFEIKTDVNSASELGLDVVVDTATNLNNVTVQLRVESIVAHGVTSNAEVAIQLEQPTTAPFVFKKSIMVASRNSNFTGGATVKTATTKIGSFTATNTGAEAINLTEFTVAETSSSSGLSVTRGYKNLKLVNNANAKAFSGVISNPVAGSGGNLLKGTLTVQAGQTAIFDVVVDATGVSTADTLQTILTSVKATGNLSKLVLSVEGIPIEGQTISF